MTETKEDIEHDIHRLIGRLEALNKSAADDLMGVIVEPQYLRLRQIEALKRLAIKFIDALENPKAD